MKTHPAAPTALAAEPALSPRTLGALLLVATLAAYLPALSAGFIWDDQPGHVTRPELTSLAGLGRIWTEPGATQQYYPLLHSAFWLEHRLWGDAPFGYHLVNLLLHATAAGLFATVLRRLAVPGAALAALLFALHPVCVESVAWISEQKNTLSLVLYLCAALAYLRFDLLRSPQTFALATGFFVAALLTKTVTATLPAALLVVFWWQRGHIAFRRDVLPLLPWFGGSLLAAIATSLFEKKLIGAEGADFALSAVQRLLLAGRAFWFYLGKLILPFDLAFIYPRVAPDTSSAQQWLALLSAVVLLGALVARRRRTRTPLAVLLLLGGGLFPALGFINVFPFLYSFVADHFQYLPSLAVFALAGAGLARITPPGRQFAIAGLTLVLGALTFQHARIYHDVFVLYANTLERNPACWMAHNNLGVALVEAGRADEAIVHFERASALRANYAECENNLGDALNRLGRSTEALPHLETALRLQPRYAEAANNLGVALMATGRPAEGLDRFAEAARLAPAFALAQRNLGLATLQTGHAEDALPFFARAVELQPDYGQAHAEWGLTLASLGRFVESIPHFETALRLNPNLIDAHVGLAATFVATGRYEAAIPHCEEALALNADHPEAHRQFALALRQTGHPAEAAQHAAEAQRLSGTR